MSSAANEDTEKSFEPTPQKLQKARDKGDVARSTDLSVAAAYAGLLIAAFSAGSAALQSLGTGLLVMVDQPDQLIEVFFSGSARPATAGWLLTIAPGILPWFIIPSIAVLASILIQRAFVVTPTKVIPKLSRISPIANAKNKFGRAGIFEFIKSFAKLILYSFCVGLYIAARLPEIIGAINSSPGKVVSLMISYSGQFLILILLIASGLAIVDVIWQNIEHRRKNMMSRKEIADETKESEGDPQIKMQRRIRGQSIATSKMFTDIPVADVVIVNPEHYAVVLKWSRKPGSAPVCVAKGVDEVAASIRECAQSAGVPIHSDPPAARAIYAATELGEEISAEHYAPVAAAIRFAENMRQRAREGV